MKPQKDLCRAYTNKMTELYQVKQKFGESHRVPGGGESVWSVLLALVYKSNAVNTSMPIDVGEHSTILL